MARIRSIKPAAFTSESLANTSVAARWTFAGLWTYVDDEGRGKADPRLVKGQLWALDDEVTSSDVADYLDELEAEGCICRYAHGGREYLHVVNWHEHQTISKPSASRLPACGIDHDRTPPDTLDASPGDTGETQGDPGDTGETPLGTGNKEEEREQGKGRGAPARETPGGGLSRFQEFWSVYPRKDDRPAAETKWRTKVIQAGLDPGMVIDAAARYRDDPGRTPKFTKHPATWLNNACWENGPIPTQGDQSRRPATTDLRYGAAEELAIELEQEAQQRNGIRPHQRMITGGAA